VSREYQNETKREGMNMKSKGSEGVKVHTSGKIRDTQKERDFHGVHYCTHACGGI